MSESKVRQSQRDVCMATWSLTGSRCVIRRPRGKLPIVWALRGTLCQGKHPLEWIKGYSLHSQEHILVLTILRMCSHSSPNILEITALKKGEGAVEARSLAELLPTFSLVTESRMLLMFPQFNVASSACRNSSTPVRTRINKTNINSYRHKTNKSLNWAGFGARSS